MWFDSQVRVWQFYPQLRLVTTHFCHHTPLAVGIDPWWVLRLRLGCAWEEGV